MTDKLEYIFCISFKAQSVEELPSSWTGQEYKQEQYSENVQAYVPNKFFSVSCCITQDRLVSCQDIFHLERLNYAIKKTQWFWVAKEMELQI